MLQARITLHILELSFSCLRASKEKNSLILAIEQLEIHPRSFQQKLLLNQKGIEIYVSKDSA